MKQILNTGFLLIMVCIFFCQCKKSQTTPTPPASNSTQPVQLASKALNVSTSSYSGPYMNGVKIHFTQNGTVSQLGLASATNGTWEVALWDSASQQLVASANVNVTGAGPYFYTNLTPAISVSTGKEYALVYYNTYTTSVTHFNYTNAAFSDLYPITEGDVVIDGQLETNGDGSAVYPFNSNLISQQNYMNSVDLSYNPGN